MTPGFSSIVSFESIAGSYSHSDPSQSHAARAETTWMKQLLGGSSIVHCLVKLPSPSWALVMVWCPNLDMIVWACCCAVEIAHSESAHIRNHNEFMKLFSCELWWWVVDYKMIGSYTESPTKPMFHPKNGTGWDRWLYSRNIRRQQSNTEWIVPTNSWLDIIASWMWTSMFMVNPGQIGLVPFNIPC